MGSRQGTKPPRNAPRIVKGALLQASWTGDKESMIQKHEQAAHEAGYLGERLPVSAAEATCGHPFRNG